MTRVLVGFHGKLPCAGDFVQRRLPVGFVDRWDTAMQAALAGIVEALGEGWKDRFGAAPSWRFVLAAHVCGPLAWAGVIASSHDRVDRPFPLMLGAPVPRGHNGWPRPPRPAWFHALDAAMERSRDAVSVSIFDAVVAMLPEPVAGPHDLPRMPDHARSLWWRDDVPGDGIAMSGLPGVPDYLRLLGVDRLEPFA